MQHWKVSRMILGSFVLQHQVHKHQDSEKYMFLTKSICTPSTHHSLLSALLVMHLSTLCPTVVGEFNKSQREAWYWWMLQWLIAQLANIVPSQSSDCPHKADYCDMCSKHKNEMNAKQTTLNRLRQSSNADPAEIKKVEDELRRKMSSIGKMHSERTSTTLKWSVAVPP